MKILHITDIHGNEKIMKKALNFKDVEIVAISGDVIETKDDIRKVKE
jgi:Icc-related predicted phosphoesterase